MSSPDGGGGRSRLFFALWPDEEVRVNLRRITSRIGRRCGGRRVHPDNTHLTLVFLGDVDAATRACAEAVGDAVVSPPFRFTLDRLGYFERPRVLWAGCALPVVEPLQALVTRLDAGVRACGIETDGRPYVPHVTLLRKAARGPLSAGMPAQEWQVEEFVLVESVTGVEGARYRVLRRWPLKP